MLIAKVLFIRSLWNITVVRLAQFNPFAEYILQSVASVQWYYQKFRETVEKPLVLISSQVFFFTYK